MANEGLMLPPGYSPLLSPRETEMAILRLKDFFQTNLAFELNLMRVTAPMFVRAGTGINDDLNGIEKPVAFTARGLDDARLEIVQSLAKWKRMTLADLGFSPGEGLYTDMNALRPDETLDNLHSLYVDQWDWERVMTPEERNLEFLQGIVRRIYDVIRRTERFISHEYHALEPCLPETITFLHSEDLAAAYPGLTPREREDRAVKEHGAIFVIGIGAKLADGAPHDGRAPDYDDWITPTGNSRRGLNGDIVLHNRVLDRAYEVSSMGIRVTPDSLREQLEITGDTDRMDRYFHRRLLDGDLPCSIGGGIGQSRLAMFYLKKAHVGEIQASVWPESMREICAKNGITLL